MVTTTTGLATSFITFSRTSNATVTDSNGFIKWAGHNLLTNSESFDAAAWAKSSATVTANTDPAPNGTTTGDTIAASGANGTALQTWTAEAVPYTFGVWLRRKTGTGSIQIAADSGTYTTVTITSSWALYTVTQTPAAGSKSAGIRIVTSGDEVYAWGAHLYRSDLGGMVLNPARGDAYYPTTPRNLLGFTEDWSNAAWTKTRVRAFGSGSVSNAAIAPNGLQTADLIAEDTTASNTHFVSQTTSSLAASPHVYSVYAKAAGRSWIAVLIDNLAVWFNLATGTKGTEESGVTGSITSIGDGWYRCTVFRTIASAGAKDCRVYLATADNSVTYTGDGTSGVYLWGAQLSDSASLDAYSPVYGAAVTSAAYYAPRLDYDANGSALGLLVEEQRSNIATHSSEFDNSTFWPRADVDVTANATAAPDGTITADKLIASATTANHLLNRTNFITVTNGLSYTHSTYAKASEYAFIRVQFQASGFLETWANFNLTTGAVGLTNGSVTTSIRAVGNGWYRCSVSATATANGNSGMQLFVLDSDRGGSSPSYLGNGTSGIFIWGAQVETSASFPTSFIPTVGNTTATRTADVASVSTQAFPYSATEGTIVVSADVLSVANTNGANLWSFYIDSNNIMRSWIWDGAKTTPRGTVVVAGSTSAEMTNGTVSANTQFKTGTALKQNDFAFSLNGASPATDPSGPVIAATNALWLGSLGGTAASSLNGHIRQITYLPRRITNAELQSRTV